LESARQVGWIATGEGFPVGSVPGSGEPVCRVYIPPGEGDSHFLSASTAECEAVTARFPSFIAENPAAFYVVKVLPTHAPTTIAPTM
jgi:hypothetical protein